MVGHGAIKLTIGKAAHWFPSIKMGQRNMPVTAVAVALADRPSPFGMKAMASPAAESTTPVPTTITVTAVNDRPLFTPGADVTVVATDPPYSSPWGTGISAGPPDETTQTLTFTVTASDPTLFSVQPAIAPDGTLTFTLAGTTGLANINVDLTDNGGTANGANNTAINRTFQITVNP